MEGHGINVGPEEKDDWFDTALDFETAWERYMADLQKESQGAPADYDTAPAQTIAEKSPVQKVHAAPKEGVLNFEESNAFSEFLDSLLEKPDDSFKIDENLQKLNESLGRPKKSFENWVPGYELYQNHDNVDNIPYIPAKQISIPTHTTQSQANPLNHHMQSNSHPTVENLRHGLPPKNPIEAYNQPHPLQEKMLSHQQPSYQTQTFQPQFQPQQTHYSQPPVMQSKSNISQLEGALPLQNNSLHSEHLPHAPDQLAAMHQQHQHIQSYPQSFPHDLSAQHSKTSIPNGNPESQIHVLDLSGSAKLAKQKRESNSRQRHLDSEKKRRATISTLYRKMCQLLPPEVTTMLPKSTVLKNTYYELLRLQERNQALRNKLKASGINCDEVPYLRLEEVPPSMIEHWSQEQD